MVCVLPAPAVPAHFELEPFRVWHVPVLGASTESSLSLLDRHKGHHVGFWAARRWILPVSDHDAALIDAVVVEVDALASRVGGAKRHALRKALGGRGGAKPVEALTDKLKHPLTGHPLTGYFTELPLLL
ncbi:hypothetical protein PG994_013445 [Apiospora phragmitis]|uniref:Uncharacterized protein n=1 Tax=Apiospora phragmitis TaxID=2905665 RepID=A0ABR1T8M9_9PEZI